jgi:heme/copper-type cytochrome/quinol oxidase subunit 2
MYRRRPGHRPTYTHGNSKAEITWTIIPALMLLGLAIWQIPTWNNIKKKFPKDGVDGHKVVTVDVLGEQFKWNIRYPGTKDKFKMKYDYSNYSNVHMPLGSTAVFNLRSKDVIHSVFIPHMRVKQDTVPGLRQRLWFKPNRTFLKDLKAPQYQDGHVWPKEADYEKKPRMVQPSVFVYTDDDKEAPADALRSKDFAAGGKLFDKKIAVEGHSELNGLYQVPVINNVAKKVKALYQGKVLESQEFASCDYAVGIFEIACAELCGLGHYTMRGFLYVDPPAVYDKWLETECEDFDEPQSQAWKFWRN